MKWISLSFEKVSRYGVWIISPSIATAISVKTFLSKPENSDVSSSNSSLNRDDRAEKFFCEPYPARAVIGASMLPFDSLVEIEAIIEKT